MSLLNQMKTQVTDDITKSQTPKTSLSLTDAKRNAPIHFEDKNVNNIVEVMNINFLHQNNDTS